MSQITTEERHKTWICYILLLVILAISINRTALVATRAFVFGIDLFCLALM